LILGVKNIIIHPKLQANHYTNSCNPEFLLQFQKKWKDSVMMLPACKRETIAYQW
jgi:hypothetical protein